MKIFANSRVLILAIFLTVLGTVLTLLDTYRLWRAAEVVEIKRDEVEMLRQKRDRVQMETFVATSSLEVEKYARNVLSWTKDGEKIVVVPNEIWEVGSKQVSIPTQENWEKWKEIVFKL